MVLEISVSRPAVNVGTSRFIFLTSLTTSINFLFIIYLTMAYSSDGESCSWLMGLSKTPEENLGFELRADLRTFLIVWCEALESI